MDPVDGDQVYAAERLLGQRTRAGKQEYLVKWKGWSAKHNTWEPAENILDDRLFQEFTERQSSEKSTRTSAGSKRKSDGSAPNSAKKDSPSNAQTPPAKRGRRSLRSKDDAEVTTPTTSVGVRRSGRAAKPKQSFDESHNEDEDESEYDVGESESERSIAGSGRKRKAPVVKPKTSVAQKIERAPLGTPPSTKIRHGTTTAAEDEEEEEDEVSTKQSDETFEKTESKITDDGEPKNSEENSLKMARDSTENSKAEVCEMPKTEDSTKTEDTEVVQSNNIQLETSAEELTETNTEDVADATVTTTASPIEAKPTDMTEDDEIPPVEIYENVIVEHKVTEENGKNEDGPNNGESATKKDTFIITNEDDPNCTHKIQVRSIPPPVRHPTENGNKNGDSNGSGNNEDDLERFEIVNSNAFFETKQWFDDDTKPTADASQSTLSNSGGIEPYQYNGSTIVTDVTVDGVTVTILEI